MNTITGTIIGACLGLILGLLIGSAMQEDYDHSHKSKIEWVGSLMQSNGQSYFIVHKYTNGTPTITP